MNWSQTKTLFLNSISKEYRNKSLFVFLALTFLFTVLISLLLDFMDGFISSQGVAAGMINFSDHKLGISFVMINFWIYLVALIIGNSLIGSDLRDNIVGQILVLPISRLQYMVSRIFGGMAIMSGFLVVNLIMVFSIAFFTNLKMPYMANAFETALLLQFPLLACLVLAVFFSLINQDKWGLLLTIGLFILIHITNTYFKLNPIEKGIGDLNGFKIIGLGIQYLFPRIGTWSSITHNSFLGGSDQGPLFLELVHLVGTIVMWSGISVFYLKKKEF